MHLPRIPVILTLLFCCSVLQGQTDPPPGSTLRKPRPAAMVLPGVQSSGAILLPNQWSLRPAGKQLELGDFPVNLALHPGGRWLAALHAGYGEHEVVIIDLKGQKIASRVSLPECFYGLCFAPDGRRLFVSGGESEVVHGFDFEDGLLFHRQDLAIVEARQKFVVSGLATDSRGQNLFAAGPWGDAVCQMPFADPGRRQLIRLPRESYPYTCLADPAGKRLYVSLWGQAAVAVLDLDKKEKAADWATEKHPTEMALGPDGKTLFVACANSTRVTVIDTVAGRTLETLSCSLYPAAPAGNTPNSLSLTPDGQILFVANADANNIAVFNVARPGESKPLGFIPSGWYPTAVRYNPADRRLYVANGKGTTSKANPQGPNDLLPKNATIRDYIGGLFRGTLGIIDMPTPERMAAYSKQAYACTPLRPDLAVSSRPAEGNPIPPRLGDGGGRTTASPIKHCIYIIKENRTYDQVFGDMKEGNGDPNLCLFPERVTPNHHRLARDFVLLDNFYVDGEVSADGHQWSMGAYATDFVEKVWPLVYRGSEKKIGYPSEGNYDSVARPAGGYLWDRCAEAGVSYRSYGEWVHNGKKPGDPARAAVKALEGHIDPLFRGFDLDYSDQKRADRFLEELAGFERRGDLPQLIILRLPNDHTSGTSPGKPTPTAQVADNDLALGRVVEGVSNSKFWKDSAIFVVEDDAQDGSDHVDAHRTVALVISPYCRRGSVDSNLYSTTSMLRTMELILGLAPMSQFDAAARPMYGSFQAKRDLTAYRHVKPDADLEEKNQATAWGARMSQQFDLTREDAADPIKLNEVIWRSVRGANSPMPPPVRAAFVMPRGKKPKDDDDLPDHVAPASSHR